MPSPVVAGALMCGIKRNYLFSQPGLGLLLKKNIFLKPNSLIAGEDIILTRRQFFITNTIASLGMKICCPIPSNSLIFAEFFPELALCPLTQLKDSKHLCQVNDTLSAWSMCLFGLRFWLCSEFHASPRHIFKQTH